MEKLSVTRAAELIQSAPALLRSLLRENRGLWEKVAQSEKSTRARELAAVMEEKGLEPDTSMAEKMANLIGMSEGELAIREDAVKIATPQSVSSFTVARERIGSAQMKPEDVFVAKLAALGT